ncbi:hypothetical protein NIES4071_60290 [Calothrix sp. NIES-4071]|nr:hypothetical protein NIES4071_60290 [Calothrix sp. NIES-4071]BAZ60336.1 hypothetical protein NIES4105_60240 [Calothrix sp. NIES-4105]
MIKARWFTLSVISFLLSMILVGCFPPVSKQLSCDIPPPNSTSTQSKPLNINIHVDGTPSMLGYVTSPNNANTRYSQTIDLLEGTLSGGQPRGFQPKFKYYRLGQTSQEIPQQRTGYLEARKPLFYDGSSSAFPSLQVSNIQTAINPGSNDNLTVIITDLYENAADLNGIANAISQNYFSTKESANAVGLFARKSEFNGNVYLEDGTNKKFIYNTNDKQGNKISEFRPFYIIFLGQYQDIKYYFDRLEKALTNNKELNKDSYLSIFSPSNIVNKLSSLQDKPKEIPQGINELASINNNKLSIEVDQQPIHIFEIAKSRTDDNREFKLNYTVPLETLSNTLSMDLQSVKTDVKVQQYDRQDKEFKQLTSTSAEKNALQLSQWGADNNKLKFVTVIKPNNFPEPGVYYLQTDVLPQELQEQNWWKDWSTDNNTTTDWKTYKLYDFLQALRARASSALQANKTTVARFCYLIQTN